MELHFVLPLFLVSLSLHFIAKIFSRNKKLKLLPGPKPWPVIGNLDLIGPLPHRSLHELSKRYGPLMQVQLGSFPVVVGSSVEMAQFFLKTMDFTMAARPPTTAGKLTGYNYSNITWSPYGAYWKQARKICFTELFNTKSLDYYENIRDEEINNMLRNIFKSSGRQIHLKDYLSTMGLNVISYMVLGKKYTDAYEGIVSSKEFKKMLDELFHLSAVMNVGDMIPCLSFLDLQGYVKRMKIVSKKFDVFWELVLGEHEERRKKSENYKGRALIDVLMQIVEDPSSEVKLERNGVKAFIQDLMAGGTESSTVIVEWAVSELLRKPQVLKRANEELNRVIGKTKWIKEKNISSLPYLDAIIKETMRLHALAPMLGRLTHEDCKVAGYDIKKGTQVMINVWTIGRDPLIWENPDEFIPERFLGRDINVKGQDFELLPFGSGRRMCPGYSLGMKLIQSSLANLLHGYNWRLPDEVKTEDLNMDETFGLSTSRKIPLNVVVEPKLSLELYSL